MRHLPQGVLPILSAFARLLPLLVLCAALTACVARNQPQAGDPGASDSGTSATSQPGQNEKVINANLEHFVLSAKIRTTGANAYHMEGALTPVTVDGQNTRSLKLTMVFRQGKNIVDKVNVKAPYNQNSGTYAIDADFTVTKPFDNIGFKYFMTYRLE